MKSKNEIKLITTDYEFESVLETIGLLIKVLSPQLPKKH